MTTFANTTAQPAADQDDAAVPPTKDASMDEIKAWVDHQLDLVGTTPVLNRFVMLGPHERRRGGTPLATSAASTMSLYGCVCQQQLCCVVRARASFAHVC